jgi:hypothetical protein
MDKSEIIEVQVEEVSDDQLTIEKIIDGFKPHLKKPITIQPKYNMTWEEFEELYKYIEEEDE